jgi:hypothetical protein
LDCELARNSSQNNTCRFATNDLAQNYTLLLVKHKETEDEEVKKEISEQKTTFHLAFVEQNTADCRSKSLR